VLSIGPYPEEFIAYLAEFFGSRDYFECHELMEALWKKEKGTGREGCWLVLVRIAVAQYHARRGNGEGAYKLLAKAAAEVDPPRMNGIGLAGERLAAMLRDKVAGWGSPADVRYEDFELPIADPSLLQAARELCAERGWKWGTPIGEVSAEIVHRHLRRDRSDVVAARKAAAESRAADRER
jgi:predicted metal-dependent hydrolase